jgi:hypothetical protein
MVRVRVFPKNSLGWVKWLGILGWWGLEVVGDDGGKILGSRKRLCLTRLLRRGFGVGEGERGWDRWDL